MIDLGDYTLDADSRCFILARKVQSKRKTGEAYESTAVIGYYRFLSSVATKLATLAAHDAIAQSKTVHGIHLAIGEQADRIEQALAPLIALSGSESS